MPSNLRRRGVGCAQLVLLNRGLAAVRNFGLAIGEGVGDSYQGGSFDFCELDARAASVEAVGDLPLHPDSLSVQPEGDAHFGTRLHAVWHLDAAARFTDLVRS